MAVKDYYLILRIPREESGAGVRSMFRALVEQSHTDRIAPRAAPTLRDIVEAYGVLSDPEKRRQYDGELRTSVTETRVEHTPRRGGLGRDAELLAPEPLGVPGDFTTLSTSPEEFRDRLSSNFTHRGVPKGERLEAFTLELCVSPYTAASGALLSVGIPVFRACSVCDGSGRDWLFPCLSCGEQGIVEEQELVEIRIPPGVVDGSSFDLPLHGLGIHNFYLRLHLRIDLQATAPF